MTGQELRDRRTRAGLSIKRLAARAGVSWTTLWRWEKAAEVPSGQVANIVAALDAAEGVGK